ncbi:alpha/beta hydrolase-fold protein [Paenibacillus turpanensis]|uniref:alpha/beta hydrolase-fold protein n=1 Tax=Paenibacillus turpanensis TaxID=2689078 RepID=UPI001409BE18
MKGVVFSDSCQERELLLYLPPSYEKGGAYPVVYVHDRGDVFDPRKSEALKRLEQLFEQGELPELILVGIEPKNRIDEYTPWLAKALTDRYGFDHFGGRGADYLAFLRDVCKPYVDRKYRTKPEAEHTALAGKSLGGLISVFSMYNSPGVFGRICCISGSFWYEGFVEYMQREPLPSTDVKVYMDVGSLEGQGKETIQQLMLARTAEAAQCLSQSGLDDNRLYYHIVEDGKHEHSYFCERFPDALRWLYQDR